MADDAEPLSGPELLARMEATWPAAKRQTLGPVTLRCGQGGGSRVSAATVEGPWTEADIPAAEAAMRAMGQRPLFLLRQGDEALDACLAERAYTVMDPVVLYLAGLSGLGPRPDALAAFAHWPPLAITRALWAEGGIGPERVAVMNRVTLPKTAILGRQADRAAGAAFVVLSGSVAFLHALEVAPDSRQRGAGAVILRAAAAWAEDAGGTWLALAVTEANVPARRLYASLGMRAVGQYHYRVLQA